MAYGMSGGVSGNLKFQMTLIIHLLNRHMRRKGSLSACVLRVIFIFAGFYTPLV
jgi:hypothetical protein